MAGVLNMRRLMIFTVFGLFILLISVFLFSIPVEAGCSISIGGINSKSPDNDWPYWADGNYSTSISYSTPNNTTLYHFTSALYSWVDVDPNVTSWSGITESYWLHIAGCSPMDFGEYTYLASLPDNPFDWYIGYLREGEYKLEIGYYCEYLVNESGNDTLYNCSSDAENIFTVLTGSGGQSSLVADFTWNPENPTIFDSIVFQSNSQISDGYITEYHWFLDDAYMSNAAGYDTWDWTSPSDGTHTVKLEIVDNNGNQDSIEYTIAVSSEEWFIIDATTGKDVEQNDPWDIVNESTSFQYGENIFASAKIGNITRGLTVDFVWTDPDFKTIRSISKNIADPNAYGYSMWESYAIWDNISVGDSSYETVFSKTGDWSVAIYVDGNPERVLDFTVASNRDLSVSVDKTHVITGEQITLSGKVTDNNIIVEDTSINIQVNRKNQIIETYTDITLDEKGSFSFPYIIPVVSFSNDHIEDWSFSISTDSTNPTIVTMTETIQFKVLSIYLELVDVKLFQIIETPDFTDWGGSYPYFALNRPAAIRIILKCPYWTKDFTEPKVTVSYSRKPYVGSSTIIEEQTIQVTNESSVLDIPFTLTQSGRYFLQVKIDPYHTFSDPATMSKYIDGLKWEDEVISKKMKTLMLRFIPVDIPSILDDPSQLAFLKRQVDFIRDVYPIPRDDIDFRCCYRYNTSLYEKSKYSFLNSISTKNLLGNYGNSRMVLVGVLPQSWWEPPTPPSLLGEEGMALKYITSAVLIKNNSYDVGVTAHEVGHTLGLRTWTEEYDLDNYYNQLYLTGFIHKDGNIVNLSNIKECKVAFPYMLRNMGRNVQSVSIYCMMGNSIHSWICKDDYIDLFRALKDPPNSQSVFVNGWINNDETVTVDNCYLLSETIANEPFNQGEYTIQIVSSSEDILYADNFGKTADEDDPFSFSIPWYDDAGYIQIKKESTVLRTILPSNHPPQVTIQNPTGGEYYTGKITAEWLGTDMDGDNLSYTVFYSHDSTNWEIINTETYNTSIQLDTSYLPGSSSCKIKVIVTDGFYIDIAESDIFTVDKKQPVCTILKEDNVPVSGIGYDLEDGELSLSDLEWYSNLQGYLGTGDILPEDILTIGNHMITMKATDSDGNTAEETIEVIITQQDATNTDGVTHVFCLDIGEQGLPIDQNTVFSYDGTVYSYVTFEDVESGDELKWWFYGPNQQSLSNSLIFESSGTMYGYAPLTLSDYPSDQAAGIWTTEIYLNDVLVKTDSFTVMSSSESPLGIAILFCSMFIILFWLKKKR